MKHNVERKNLRKGDVATVEVRIARDVFTITGPVRIDTVGNLNLLGYPLTAQNVKFISAEREAPEFAAGTIGQATLDTGRSVRGAWLVRHDGENLFAAFQAVGSNQVFIRKRVTRFVEDTPEVDLEFDFYLGG